MDIKRLKERIIALREKTVANGCTEGEALAAAEKAAQLMRDANLSELDLTMGDRSINCKTSAHSKEAILWTAVAHCTNCDFVLSRRFDGNQLIFIGKEPGPEVAAYLWTVCDRAIKKAVREFKKSVFYRRRRTITTKRQAVSDFKLGMALRLRQRLYELFETVINVEDLEEANRAKLERYPNLQGIKRRETNVRFEDVVGSGFAAAQDINLTFGVAASAAKKELSGAA